MLKSLIIDLVNLPEEGKAFTGDLDPSIFNLSRDDAQPTTPLQYDLHVQRFDEELLLRGAIAASFEFTCVRDNQKFIQTIDLEDTALAIEIDAASIDATEALREEILINFPAYPRCNEADEPHTCEIDDRYLAVDKPIEDGVDDAPLNEGDDRWGALDSFKDLSE